MIGRDSYDLPTARQVSVRQRERCSSHFYIEYMLDAAAEDMPTVLLIEAASATIQQPVVAEPSGSSMTSAVIPALL